MQQDIVSKEQASGVASQLFLQMPLEARSAETELFGNHFYLPMSLKDVCRNILIYVCAYAYMHIRRSDTVVVECCFTNSSLLCSRKLPLTSPTIT